MADPSIPTKAEIDAAFSPALYDSLAPMPATDIPSFRVLDSLHIFSLAAGIHDWFLIERLSFRYPT
ncbi:hypothetical protein H0H93_015930, partial [Arthromyces matolae]